MPFRFPVASCIKSIFERKKKTVNLLGKIKLLDLNPGLWSLLLSRRMCNIKFVSINTYGIMN